MTIVVVLAVCTVALVVVRSLQMTVSSAVIQIGIIPQILMIISTVALQESVLSLIPPILRCVSCLAVLAVSLSSDHFVEIRDLIIV